MDFGGIFAYLDMHPGGGHNETEPQEEGDPSAWVYSFLALIIIELTLTCVLLLYGAILKGWKLFLIAWMGTATVFVAIFIFVEFYFIDWTFVETMQNLNIVYFIVMTSTIYAYQIHFSLQCLPSFAMISELEPIGKGWRFILDFFKLHAREAAMLVLMFEMVFNVELFLDRQVSRFVFGQEFMGHEADTNVAVLLEETVLRYVRIGLAIAGFYISYRDKKYWMQQWCLAYLVTIAISLGLFLYLVIMWRAEHVLLTLLYFGLFSVNLLYRTGLLFVCVRYTDVFERLGLPM